MDPMLIALAGLAVMGAAAAAAAAGAATDDGKRDAVPVRVRDRRRGRHGPGGPRG